MGKLDCALGARYCGDLVDCSGGQTLRLAHQLRQLRHIGHDARCLIAYDLDGLPLM
jgi:hypothetical protein